MPRSPSSVFQVLRTSIFIACIAATALGLLWLTGEIALAQAVAGHGAAGLYDSATENMLTARPMNAALATLAALFAALLVFPRRRRDRGDRPRIVSRTVISQPVLHEAVGLA